MKSSILFILAFALLFSQKVFSCSCVGQPDDIEIAVTEAFNKASSVVWAKAVSITPSSSKMEHPGQGEDFDAESETTHFTEIQSWKGDHGKQFYTNIVTMCCVCGRSFNEGEEYLLYLYKNKDENTYGTGICLRTKHVRYARDDIKILNQLVPNKSLQPTAKAPAE